MISEAVDDLREGKPVLVYDFDDREAETDIVYAAEKVDHDDIARLRNDAGGLICTAIHPEAAERLGLPFIADVLEDNPLVEEAGDLGYDSRSSFSLWVNHKSNYTGITDKDRAKTARKLSKAVGSSISESASEESLSIEEEFRTPGHMAVLRADEDLLEGRQGQTEMSVKLVDEAGLTPAAVICEMLDDEMGEALSKENAKRYADENGLTFVEGRQLVEVADAES